MTNLVPAVDGGRVYAEPAIDVDELAPQTVRVCRLIIQGRTADETALELGMGRNTVKEHLKRARQHLARSGRPVHNVVHLRAALREDGYLDGIPLL